jgi:hypothetical protein
MVRAGLDKSLTTIDVTNCQYKFSKMHFQLEKIAQNALNCNKSSRNAQK